MVYEGVAELPAPELPFPLPHPYVLAVGNAYPHKNMETLLRAFRLVRTAHPDLRLIFAGREDVFARRLVESPNARALEEAFLFIPNPTDRHLAALYDRALVFVFPSLIEGFGFPPLEAMKSGLPVAASRAGSLPEILGDAALFFDPRSPEEMAHCLIRLVEDPALRTNLISKGREHVKRFSFERMARETERLYHEVVRKR